MYVIQEGASALPLDLALGQDWPPSPTELSGSTWHQLVFPPILWVTTLGRTVTGGTLSLWLKLGPLTWLHSVG